MARRASHLRLIGLLAFTVLQGLTHAQPHAQPQAQPRAVAVPFLTSPDREGGVFFAAQCDAFTKPVAHAQGSFVEHSNSAAQPQWIAPAPQVQAGPTPSWIWVAPPGEPAPTTANAPAGEAFFAHAFDAPHEGAAMLAVAADNHAAVWLNGEEVARADSWSTPVMREVSLRAGRNLIVVEARNDGAAEGARNPAGLILRLGRTPAVTPGPAGEPAWVVSGEGWLGATARWQGFPSLPPDAGAATPVAVLGAAGTPPWGLAASAFEPSPPCPMLRRSFTIDDEIVSAKVRLVGLGHYELTCNGGVVGSTVINQAWSQYDKTLYVQEFDLPLGRGPGSLRRGENVFGVLLGNSFWWVGPTNDANRYAKTDAMPDFSEGWPHLLWLEATITTTSGEVRVLSDEVWRWAESPLTFSHIYGGEDWDARLEQPGWDAPGFMARRGAKPWREVVVAPAPKAELVPLPCRGMVRKSYIGTDDVRKVAPGVYTYVFPQNCAALVEFNFYEGKPGQRIRFRPCEYMEDSGRVKFTYTWGTGKDIWHDYIVGSHHVGMHAPKFCFVGAQFVQVEGAVPLGEPNPDRLPVLKWVRLVPVRSDTFVAGEFESSSPMHNAAHGIIDWAIRSNMAHVPMDCPHREKAGWIEQNWHMARSVSYGYEVLEWFGKTCRDIRDAQQPDGHIPTNCPNVLVGVPPHGFWNNAPEWGIAGVLLPWHLYEWYDDLSVLESSYESARRYIDYLGTTAKDGIITSNLGDWYDFGHGQGNGPSRWTPNEVSATAIWAYGADTLARMAEALGKADDAARYRALHARIRADFQRHFYDPVTRTVKHNGSCQAGTAAALCIGLIPEADRAGALDAIVADLEARRWKQTPGEVLQIFLIRALAENGRGDVLHRIYNRDDIPSYGHMVKTGLTTLPESWDARRGTGDSLNHFMLGHLMEWHYAYVAGLRQAPGGRGWKDVLIAPQPPPADAGPNAITSCAVEFMSPEGTVAVSWKISEGRFRLVCRLPEQVKATVVLPDGSRHVVEGAGGAFSCATP